MYETDLAADCVAGLRAALPAETEVEVRNEAWRPGAPFTDGWLQMFGPWGRIEVPFEVRPRINNAAVALMERRFQEIQGPERTGLPAWILLTEYVNPEEARRLRKGGIAFADTCGNAHVWGEALYVWVTGNRPKTRRMRTPGLTRPAAARVLFVLLQEPGRAREPYRELAALANVAPDTVHRVFNDLQKKGFLRTWGTRERELLRVPELVELWTLGYGDALRPKLRPKPCHWVDGGEMADLLDMLPADTTTPGTLLGGEAAAAVLTDSIRPTKATLHIPHEDQRAVMKTLGLVPMPDGPITLVDTFGTTNEWPHPQGRSARLADPLLIHAELLREDDDRATAVAGEIYDNYILKRFGDDPRA